MKSYRDFIFHSGVKGMKWGDRNEETLRKYGLLSKNGPNPIAKVAKDVVSGNAAGVSSGDSSEEEEWVEVIDPATGEVKRYPKWMVKVKKSLSSDKKIAVYDKKTGKVINSKKAIGSKVYDKLLKDAVDSGKKRVQNLLEKHSEFRKKDLSMTEEDRDILRQKLKEERRRQQNK